MVKNVHERVFWASRGEVGDLIDGLGSEDDGIWPRDGWPPLRLDRPLGVGAAGGHGPISYRVEEYEPGRSVRFRFVGSEGTHGLELTEVGSGTVRLRHELVLKPRGFGRLSWALVTRPLHDALVEDLLDRAEAHASGGSAEPRAWSWRVRMLRRILGRSGRAAAALREGNATVGHGEPEDAGNVGALLDEIMPEYEFNEVHRIRVAAPPEQRASDALKRVTPGEMPLVRLPMRYCTDGGPRMRLPNSAHTSRPWRIHELARAFRLEDVWALPTPGGPDDFPRLVRMMASSVPSRGPSRAARALWAIRWKVGGLLGWDGPDAGLGSGVPTLRDRLPQDLREAPGPDFDALPFASLCLIDDEFAAEIANRTMHAIMHLGWVSDGTGGYRGQMAVLVKPNGLLGTAYMAAIKPFRHLIVYPPMMREIGRNWRAHARHPG